MVQGTEMLVDWAARYATLLAGLHDQAATAPLTLCGMGTCVDARVSLHDLAVALDSPVAEAAAFARVLQARAARGVGGELAYDWPEGPAWIAAHCPVARAMGGTGPHAAWVLTAAGAPALLALADRSAAMLALVPPEILLAEGEALVPAGSVAPHGDGRPEVFIFEYTAGRAIGDVVPSRSSRIIVRFADLGLEHDADFDGAALRHAPQAGAGLVSGFSAVPAAEMAGEVERVFALARAWRDAGLATIHLELAGYDPPDGVLAVLAAARGVVTSIGMSHSEFRALRDEGQDLGQALAAFGDDLVVERICIHADHWAASVTRRDPDREEEALMTGCLLAAARAGAGHPVRPDRLPEGSGFATLPFPARRRLGAWHFVACPSPYLPQPATTLGLGDSFTAGCLLALGRPVPATV